MTQEPRHHSDSNERLLVALAVAALLHVATIAVISWFIAFEAPRPEQRHEVTLVPPPEPTPPKEIEEPRPEPAQTARPQARPRSRSAQQRTEQATQGALPESTELPPLSPEPPLPEPVGPPKLSAKDLAFDFQRFERTFGEEVEQERAEYVDSSKSKRRAAGFNFGRLGAKVRGALGQKRGWVQPGNQEPLGERKKTAHNYLYLAHELIHPLFADGFLDSLTSLSPSDPLNNFDLQMAAEFEILENGDISEVRVVRPSGNTVFDAAAVDSLYRAAPYPPPPPQILSWNRRFYVRWGFYRNSRKCGMFNAEPYILSAPSARPEPLPPDKLIVDG
ncbi:MAG: energy transducer TonB [Myxococcota bacterium]|nr:energy transducer TonB [Myxococcota bacterium]